CACADDYGGKRRGADACDDRRDGALRARSRKSPDSRLRTLDAAGKTRRNQRGDAPLAEAPFPDVAERVSDRISGPRPPTHFAGARESSTDLTAVFCHSPSPMSDSADDSFSYAEPDDPRLKRFVI